MPMCHLIEYSDKRGEVPDNNDDLAVNNSESFQYKAALVGKTADYVNSNSFVKNTIIVVSLRYLSNF